MKLERRDIALILIYLSWTVIPWAMLALNTMTYL
jgi:TM2 domain-containing membrane protein YozV